MQSGDEEGEEEAGANGTTGNALPSPDDARKPCANRTPGLLDRQHIPSALPSSSSKAADGGRFTDADFERMAKVAGLSAVKFKRKFDRGDVKLDEDGNPIVFSKKEMKQLRKAEEKAKKKAEEEAARSGDKRKRDGEEDEKPKKKKKKSRHAE